MFSRRRPSSGKRSERVPPSDPEGPTPGPGETARPIGHRCGNADGNESLNITDVIYILNFLFVAGPPPQVARNEVLTNHPPSEGVPPGEPGRFEIGASGLTVTDLRTGLEWQRTPTTGMVNWELALKEAEELVLDQQDDWRLPNVEELFSLIDFTAGSTFIASGFMPNTDAGNTFWTSTTIRDTNANAVVIRVVNNPNLIIQQNKESPMSIQRFWPVRGGQVLSEPLINPDQNRDWAEGTYLNGRSCACVHTSGC